MACLFSQSPAQAFFYNESAEGDLSGGVVGDLEVGQNLIEGSLGSTDFLDNFVLSLPLETEGEISAIKLTVSNAVDPFNVVDTCLQIVSPLYTGCIALDGEDSVPLSLLPLQPGNYSMQVVFSGSIIQVSSDWELEITVLAPQAVPSLGPITWVTQATPS